MDTCLAMFLLILTKKIELFKVSDIVTKPNQKPKLNDASRIIQCWNMASVLILKAK